MMRSAFIVFSIFCIATLLSEAIALGILWYRGQLNGHAVRDIAAILAGRDPAGSEPAADDGGARPSSEEIMEQRVLRTFDLGVRETELGVLKDMVSEKRAELLVEKARFEKERQEFEQRLRQLNENLTADATEQTRGVLQALSPEDAVANLMQLDLDENVVLLQGMTPRGIGRILKEFGNGGEEERRRGREIFASLSQGEPSKSLVEAAAGALTQP